MPDGSKTRLRMTRYTVSDDGSTTIVDGVFFNVLLNPADIKHSRGISYDKKKAQGQTAVDPRFAAMEAEKLSFSLLLDGTGAVPREPGEALREVKDMLDDLNKVLYRYEGNQHEPGRVRLLWGPLIFFGRLEGMTIAYTLFKPSGAPLRAKLELNFVGAMSKNAARLESNLSSPDLSHLVLVRQGDTLPLLCQRIYGDPGYYIDVAAYNQLPDFRLLRPGLQLHFPPLE